MMPELLVELLELLELDELVEVPPSSPPELLDDVPPSFVPLELVDDVEDEEDELDELPVPPSSGAKKARVTLVLPTVGTTFTSVIATDFPLVSRSVPSRRGSPRFSTRSWLQVTLPIEQGTVVVWWRVGSIVPLRFR
jgi:hypothetical protein